MKRNEWYAARNRIVLAQDKLGKLIGDLEEFFKKYVGDMPPDPVTHRNPISIIKQEKFTESGRAFGIQSVTGTNVTLSLKERSDQIRIEPAVEVGEAGRVSAIKEVLTPTSGQTLLIVTGTDAVYRDPAERQISVDALFAALEDAVLTPEGR